MRTTLTVLFGLMVCTGCETLGASSFPTPKTRVTECEKICTDVGMKLGALVVMMEHAGCVCEPLSAAAHAPNSSLGGATAAGAAAISAVQAQRNQAARPVR